INMAMPPSKPARKIRFIKSPLVANCAAPSLPEVSATKSRGSTESRARNGAFDGRLRQHYENITTYAVAFPSLAFASEQGDLEKPQTITPCENRCANNRRRAGGIRHGNVPFAGRDQASHSGTGRVPAVPHRRVQYGRIWPSASATRLRRGDDKERASSQARRQSLRHDRPEFLVCSRFVSR